VVEYDVAGGVLETRAGKTFVIDKAAGEDNTALWQEYPAYFHYRCEQTTSSCTLVRAGASVMHAKLKRLKSAAWMHSSLDAFGHLLCSLFASLRVQEIFRQTNRFTTLWRS